MSDYLNNIVSRSLSVADVVQPRVPHLFEQAPVAVAPEPALTVESGIERFVEISRPDDSTVTPVPAMPHPPPAPAPLFEPARAAPLPEVFVPPVAVMPEGSQPVTEVKYNVAPPAPRNEPAKRDEIDVRVTPVIRSAVTEPQPPLVTRRPQSRRAPEPAVTAQVGPPSTEAPSTIHSDQPVTGHRRSHPSVSNTAVVATRPQPAQVEQELPAIRINIGRVDVRAVMPAAPPVATHSPRPRPAMSLESYLKQREEGKR